jgi:MbtH protein
MTEKETTMHRKNQADQEDKRIYKVVKNHEQQYSIWPADWENPLGWWDEGKRGSQTECISYIQQVWTDMRPKSLRQNMDHAVSNVV